LTGEIINIEMADKHFDNSYLNGVTFGDVKPFYL